jgi:hypothetical protein
MKIDEIGGRVSVVANDVPHQDIEDVVIDGSFFARFQMNLIYPQIWEFPNLYHGSATKRFNSYSF